MSDTLNRLRRRHRRLDRLIDTSKSHGKQEEVKVLKRLRLRLRDKIAAMTRYPTPRPSQGG